jgi:hypothetical protein
MYTPSWNEAGAKSMVDAGNARVSYRSSNPTHGEISESVEPRTTEEETYDTRVAPEPYHYDQIRNSNAGIVQQDLCKDKRG